MHVSVLDTAPPCPVIDVHTNSSGGTGVSGAQNHRFTLETPRLFEVTTREQTQVERNHTKRDLRALASVHTQRG